MDGLVDAGFMLLGGPLADEHRVAHVVDAESVDELTGEPQQPYAGFIGSAVLDPASSSRS
jgi:hypothetical protein